MPGSLGAFPKAGEKIVVDSPSIRYTSQFIEAKYEYHTTLVESTGTTHKVQFCHLLFLSSFYVNGILIILMIFTC